MNPLTYQLDVRTRRDDLWRDLTTPRGLSAWLCQRAVVEPVVGGRLDLHWMEGFLEGRFRTLDEPRQIVAEFGRVNESDHDEVADSPAAWLVAELRPTLDGTRLEVTLDRFASEEDRSWHEQFWPLRLERLLTRHHLVPGK